MIRVFVAIDLPAEIKEELEKMARRIEALRLDGRISNIRGLHLTLKFLGNIEEARVPAVAETIRSGARGIDLFQLRVRGVGVFPNAARPRVIWAGVDAHPELIELQSRVESGLAAIGFKPEKRTYRPHLTLMRLKSTRNHRDLLRYLREEARQEDGGSFPVQALHLYRSILKPTGAEYQILQSFPL